MAHKIGTLIRQKVPVISGTVSDVKYDATTTRFSYLVNYQDADGVHERWFDQDDIEPTTEGEAA